MLSANNIYQGDCLEVMKSIDDKSIDMILCDLPYGTTACGWDSIIPFDKLWSQYNRIIKNNSPIVLFCSQPFTSALLMSNTKMFREELCWLKNKAGSGFQANQKHIKIHENILVFSKQGKYTFNPQKWLVDSKEFLTQRKTFDKFEIANNEIYGEMVINRKPDNGTRNPLSILSCRTPHVSSKTKRYNSDVEIKLHPTQKPIELCEYLIKTYSNEGDLVLDNCCGSGTTCLAAKNLNRNYIGIEKEEKYVEIANARLK